MGVKLAGVPGRSSAPNCVHGAVKCRVLLCRRCGGLARHRTGKARGFAPRRTRAALNFARSVRTRGTLLGSEFGFILPAENGTTCQWHGRCVYSRNNNITNIW